MEALNAIVAVLNSWAEADLAKIRATRDDLKSQVLHRMPPVIPRPQREPLPPRRRGEGPRAMRQRDAPLPGREGTEGRGCYFCGETGHYRSTCPHMKTIDRAAPILDTEPPR